jgi:phosphatidate cytidylyltransferase
MHDIVYYTLSFAVIGAAGMAISSRKAEKKVRQQRWLKYFMYILITATVLFSISYGFFLWVALVIAGASLIELTINNLRSKAPLGRFILSSLILILTATGFVKFADTFSWSFLLYIYFQILIFDGFCQVSGQLWGKHALAPSISPTKTVEGLAGGWICCVIAALLAASWTNASFQEACIFGVLTGLGSFCGDITASFYKRKLGIKDYSNWLPGQGGFLDRFDSLLATGFMYYMIYIVNGHL